VRAYTHAYNTHNSYANILLIISFDYFFTGLHFYGGFMKKSYLTPSINVVSYNVVDIVTTSVTTSYAHVKESWLESDWLN